MANKFDKWTIDDVDVKGKRVLVRCDFNVPIINGVITDNNRIVAALPTIKTLIKNGGKVILCSHIGKPEKKLTLEPVSKELSKLLKKDVKFLKSEKVVDDSVKSEVSKLNDGDVCLLENTRLRPEEMDNDDTYAKELASLCEVYVDDAFGTAHRAHSSNVGITKYVSKSVSGYLMQVEIDKLMNAVENPKRPFIAILGGAKISDKLKVIEKLIEKCDKLLIGGGMSFTFLKAMGYEVGKSLVDDEKIPYCKDMIKKAMTLGKKLILPIDCVASKTFPDPIDDAKIETKTFSVKDMPLDYMGLDVGEETIKLYIKELSGAKTVIWNGPVGIFENQKLALGTYSVARILADMKDAITIVGGGDSASAVAAFKLKDKMTHVSTGGGVTLEFLEGKSLPGVEAITDK